MTTTLVGSAPLREFMAESLRIDRVTRDPTPAELATTAWFLELEVVRVSDLIRLVGVYVPGARLRDMPGMNVRVGSHRPPPGGPAITTALQMLLLQLPAGDPWHTHLAYELLHPFSDGNGRTGRALWAWQMVRRHDGLPLGFLHAFYYQTLERSSA